MYVIVTPTPTVIEVLLGVAKVGAVLEKATVKGYVLHEGIVLHTDAVTE